MKTHGNIVNSVEDVVCSKRAQLVDTFEAIANECVVFPCKAFRASIVAEVRSHTDKLVPIQSHNSTVSKSSAIGQEPFFQREQTLR